MRILILTPVTERAEYSTLHLMAELNKRGYNAISVPAFANYLLTVKLADNEEQAIVKALISVRDLPINSGDFIVIGNSPKDIKYDFIFEMNINHEEGVAIADKQLDRMRKKFANDPEIMALLNTYGVEDADSHLGGTVDQIATFVDNVWKANLNNKQSSPAMNPIS